MPHPRNATDAVKKSNYKIKNQNAEIFRIENQKTINLSD